MHCPNCGKAADADQQFCRACGMSLDTVGKLVAEHTSTTLPEHIANKSELEQEIVRRMFRWITWGMILLGIGVLLMVANKSFELGSAVKFLSSVICIAGVGVATTGVIKSINQGSSLPARKSGGRISGSVDTKSLPTSEMPASLPSITERTTHLLPTDQPHATNVIDSNRRE